MGEEKKELSFGEKKVGLHFNPAESDLVRNIKIGFAEAIDSLHALGQNTEDEETKDMFDIAIKKTQEACMWAVKAITW